MRKHVYVDHIAATAEEIMQNSIGIFPFPAFSRCVHVYYMHCICWRNKNQGFGLFSPIFLIFSGLIASKCNTEAVVNGSPSFCVKKGKYSFEQSKVKSCLASQCSTELHNSSHQHSHFNSCTQPGRKNNTGFLHNRGMGLEDKVSL